MINLPLSLRLAQNSKKQNIPLAKQRVSFLGNNADTFERNNLKKFPDRLNIYRVNKPKNYNFSFYGNKDLSIENKFLKKEITLPSEIKIDNDIINKVGTLLKNDGYKNLVIIYGNSNNGKNFNEILESQFKNAKINVVITSPAYTDRSEAIEKMATMIPEFADGIIGIGGGITLDFARYLAHLKKVPFICIPTSISTDGASSPIASLIKPDGTRFSFETGVPSSVIIDTNIINNIPEELAYAGIGDLISKTSAARDWYSSRKVGQGSSNCDMAFSIAQLALNSVLRDKNPDIKDPEFLNNLTNSLLVSGFTMEIADTRRVASGSEHLISAIMDKSPNHSLHGLQVSVATYLCTYLQDEKTHETVKEFFKKCGFIDYMKQHPLDKDLFIDAVRKVPEYRSKEIYYSVFSMDETVDKALNFIENDEIMKEILK